MIEIRQATTEIEFDSVCALVCAFMDWLKQHYPNTQDLVDQYLKRLKQNWVLCPASMSLRQGRC